MNLWLEIGKFILYSLLIVLTAKYFLVTILRKLAESLNLKPKTVGNIAGIATSVPEFLTVSFSAFTGLIGASIYNILSSNVINTLQYIGSVMANKNGKLLKNKAIKINMLLVGFTIILPLLVMVTNLETNLIVVFAFVILFFVFYFINNKVHKRYLKEIDQKIEEEIVEEEKEMKKKKKGIIVRYTISLIIIGVILFVLGNLLSGSLENLAEFFHVPEVVIGIALGFVTSIPELITFFETQKHHKKQRNELMGIVEATSNLLTSNMLNLFIIQSIGVLIYCFL